MRSYKWKTSKKSTRRVVSKRSGEKSRCQNTDSETVKSLMYSSKPHVGFKLSPEEQRWTSYHPGHHVYHPLCLQCTQICIAYFLFLLFFGGNCPLRFRSPCVHRWCEGSVFLQFPSRTKSTAAHSSSSPQSSPSDAALLVSLSDAEMGSAPGG